MAYTEQVGVKRQEGGRSGEIKYLYPLISPRSTDLGNRYNLLFTFIYLPNFEPISEITA